MKYLFALMATLVLTACSTTVPVTMKFPDIPEDLKQTCPDLDKLPPDTTKLSQVIAGVSKNYEKYHDCKIKVDSWLEWYTTQKKIYENVK